MYTRNNFHRSKLVRMMKKRKGSVSHRLIKITMLRIKLKKLVRKYLLILMLHWISIQINSQSQIEKILNWKTLNHQKWAWQFQTNNLLISKKSLTTFKRRVGVQAGGKINFKLISSDKTFNLSRRILLIRVLMRIENIFKMHSDHKLNLNHRLN